jgi:hypothetical protein
MQPYRLILVNYAEMTKYGMILEQGVSYMDTKNLCELRDQLRILLAELEELGPEGILAIQTEVQAVKESEVIQAAG